MYVNSLLTVKEKSAETRDGIAGTWVNFTTRLAHNFLLYTCRMRVIWNNARYLE